MESFGDDLERERGAAAPQGCHQLGKEQGPHHGCVPAGAAFVLRQSQDSRLENSSAVIGVENIG
jgi:hypothetical protein